jgi:hypothetical protein
MKFSGKDQYVVFDRPRDRHFDQLLRPTDSAEKRGPPTNAA